MPISGEISGLLSVTTKLIVCVGKHCRKRGSKDVLCALEKQIGRFEADDDICLKKRDCLGFCGQGPAIAIKESKIRYGKVDPKDCADIVRQLIKDKKPIKRLALKK